MSQRTEEGEVAGLFERMSLVIRSKLNRLLDRAEDPSETLDYSYEEQLKLLQNVKRGVADVVTSKKQLQDLDVQVQQLEAQQEKLTSSERQLNAKIEAFRSQKEVIKAQYSAAEAQVRIGEAATGIGEQMADTGLAIQRAKDKTEQMQARAGAVEELIEAGTLEDFTTEKTSLDRELEALTTASEVDADLARLRAEIGAGEQRQE